MEGSDLAALAEAADRLEVPAYQTGVPAIAADAGDVRDTVGPDARIGYILRPTYPNLRDGGEVADGGRRAARRRRGIHRLLQLRTYAAAVAGLDPCRLVLK